MNGESYLMWESMKQWCQKHPEETAAIVTPDGTFTITFSQQPTNVVTVPVVQWRESEEIEPQ